MEQKYCMNCMRPLGASPVCARCGFDNSQNTQTEPYHLIPGTILAGRYLVGNVIGEGGFGITYIGLHVKLSRRVAIKEFYPSGAANRTNTVSEEIIITRDKREFFQNGVERFMNEAKSVAAFPDEDGIVDVIDYFQENNTAYIVMEYLDGITLKDYVRQRGIFYPAELIRLMIPLMKSLSVIHSRGIIHRDISPDNIMYTSGGKLKLMDFGSARYFTNEERKMSVILKQGFAPEEQYRTNGNQGPHTDVYALCATIYACITGTVPPGSLDRLAQDTLTPPSRMGVPISPQQERALMHGLAVSIASRTPDIQTLMSELTAAQEEAPAAKPAAVKPAASVKSGDTGKKKKKNRLPLILGISIPAAAAIAAAIVLPIVFGSSGSTPQSGTSGGAKSSAVIDDSSAAPGIHQYLSDISSLVSDGSSQQSSKAYSGLTAEQAKQAPKELSVMLLNELGRRDNVASGSDRFVINTIWYGQTDDGDYRSLIYLYHNDTSNYYRVVELDPEYIELSGGEAGYSGNYAFGNTASDPETAKKSCMMLSSGSEYYVITEVCADASSYVADATASTANRKKGADFGAEDAKKYVEQLTALLLDNVAENDGRAEESDKIEVKNIYYVYCPEDGYTRIVFIYYNKTDKYYRGMEIAPESISVNNQKLVYDVDYFDPSEEASTLEAAARNVFYLDDTTGFYEITTIM